MQRFLFTIFIFCFFIISPVQPQTGTQWGLVWQDTFERTELGNDWKVDGKASIENGRLKLDGNIWALCTRQFKADVRLEFDAWTLPDKEPGGLSVTLYSGEESGWGYLLGFGMHQNRMNLFMGPGVNHEYKNPTFLIKPGKIHHLVAQKEGRKITYRVDGRIIIDEKTDDTIGGPEFDQIGLITWSGMYVDNVKVYERETPHPDTIYTFSSLPEGPLYRDGRHLIIRDGVSSPVLDKAVAAFNNGKLNDALKQFRSMGNSLVGLLGQAYVLGDIDHREPFHNDEFIKLAKQFRKASAADSDNKVLSDYALASDWFSDLKMQRGSALTRATIRLGELGPENNPFYFKSLFYEARVNYWNGKEWARKDLTQQSVEQMKDLQKFWPENVILKQYTGEDVLWGEELNADASHHPEWAAYLREAYNRQIKMMEHFIAKRQSPDGLLGGGYGDDVELLRTWVPVAAISSGAGKVRSGIERLCEGVWDTALVKGKGYDCIFSDVEHSSEPSADSLPGMLVLRYGDPLWVERNLQTCRTIKNYYMGVDEKGYSRFKSSYFGNLKVEPKVEYGGDTGYCARPMKHFLWAAWQGNPDARDWYVRWADGWQTATMKQIDSKMVGIVPSSIWYPSGSIFPPVEDVPWYDEKLNYWPRPDMIHDVFLSSYYLTHDAKFLKPFESTVDYASSSATGDKPVRGSREWQIEESRRTLEPAYGKQDNASLYRWLKGDCINVDPEKRMKRLRKDVESLRYNPDLHTTEVLSTDRAGLNGALDVFAAYTGAITTMRDAETPTFAVTYDTPSINFAALVTKASRDRLMVLLYNFEGNPMPVKLKLWNLVPGKYLLSQGEQTKELRTHIVVMHRADGPVVTVPSRKTWQVDLRLEKAIQVPPAAPDLAISKGDIVRVRGGLKVTVHNIGNKDAGAYTTALQKKVNGKWRTVESVKALKLQFPRNMVPFTASVLFKTKTAPGVDYRVSIDPQDAVYELCEDNNTSLLSKL